MFAPLESWKVLPHGQSTEVLVAHDDPIVDDPWAAPRRLSESPR